LRKILIFSDKLLQGSKPVLTAELDSYIQKIVKSSERMHILINDLLKFSRYTKDDYGFERTDLNAILKDVLSDVEMEVQKKNAVVEVSELPTIWAIPSQMRQVFQNLISNSLKFSKPGTPPQLTITGRQVTGSEIFGLNRRVPNDNYYRIFFQDNGIGFDPKYANEFFVVFKSFQFYQCHFHSLLEYCCLNDSFR